MLVYIHELIRGQITNISRARLAPNWQTEEKTKITEISLNILFISVNHLMKVSCHKQSREEIHYSWTSDFFCSVQTCCTNKVSLNMAPGSWMCYCVCVFLCMLLCVCVCVCVCVCFCVCYSLCYCVCVCWCLISDGGCSWIVSWTFGSSPELSAGEWSVEKGSVGCGRGSVGHGRGFGFHGRDSVVWGQGSEVWLIETQTSSLLLQSRSSHLL